MKKRTLFAVLAAALVMGIGIVATYQVAAQSESGAAVSQTAAEQGITFPIQDLGNCADKGACRAYCNDSAHIPQCVKFAEAHGLMNKDEASRARKFAETLRGSGGPGGCASAEGCKAFCGDIKNIDACVAFAEENGVRDEHYIEGKKLRDYLKSGGALPGGCTSRASCETYCRDLAHLEECVAFAEKAGMGPASAPGQFGKAEGAPNLEQVRKFVALAKSGETPGGCTSKEGCEAYCKAAEHLEACIAFGTKVGFVTEAQASRLRQAGGRGPGGCNSEASCHAYCNDPARRDECFSFAKENGLLKEEEIQQAKDGFVRLRQGLEQAPLEVVECLKSTLGQNIISDIQSGALTPGPEIGERVKGCFEKFGKQAAPQAAFREMPQEIQVCLKEKFGNEFDAVRTGKIELTPERADAFRVCAQSLRLEEGSGVSQGLATGQFLRSAPSAVVACIKEKLGGTFSLENPESLMQDPQIREKVKGCFESFRPSGGLVEFQEGAIDMPRPPIQATPLQSGQGFSALPDPIVRCLKERMEPTLFEKIRLGGQPPLEAEFRALVTQCASQIPKVSAPVDQPTDATRICIQVIAPARDPQTGTCKEFPTPCEVPTGWYRVPSCSTTSGTLPPPSAYPSQTYTVPTVTPPPTMVCSDYATCKAACTDLRSAYYNVDICMKFRASQPTSYGEPPAFTGLLGVLLDPFLNIVSR